MPSWEAQGKTFVITGGASGLGAHYVKSFLQQGAKSIAVFDIAEAEGKALAEEYPDRVTFIRCDMSKEDDIAKSFDEVVARFGQVDVIINNAGVMVDAPDVWRTASTVNFQGLVSLTLRGIKHMDISEGGGGGTIVNIASIAGIVVLPEIPIYCAAKTAVINFCRCISADPFYATTGVRLLCMCLGPTDTSLLHNLQTRAYNPALGQKLHDSVKQNGVYFQKIESAVDSVMAMFENGSDGSIWTSVDDKPVKDITSTVKQAFSLLENEVTG